MGVRMQMGVGLLSMLGQFLHCSVIYETCKENGNINQQYPGFFRTKVEQAEYVKQYSQAMKPTKTDPIGSGENDWERRCIREYEKCKKNVNINQQYTAFVRDKAAQAEFAKPQVMKPTKSYPICSLGNDRKVWEGPNARKRRHILNGPFYHSCCKSEYEKCKENRHINKKYTAFSRDKAERAEFAKSHVMKTTKSYPICSPNAGKRRRILNGLFHHSCCQSYRYFYAPPTAVNLSGIRVRIVQLLKDKQYFVHESCSQCSNDCRCQCRQPTSNIYTAVAWKYRNARLAKDRYQIVHIKLPGGCKCLNI